MASSEAWDELALLDCTSDRQISYGIVQPGSDIPMGVPIVRVNNLRDGRIETRDAMRVAAEIEKPYQRTRLIGGELLLSLVGTTGNVAIVPPHMNGWNVARAIAVIRPKENIGASWLKLCLESTATREYLDARANTTVQKTLNLSDVKRLPIPLPPLHWREEILSVISPLDERISVLHAEIGTLEALARTIFKSWFVDFDPVRAKAEGREPEGMDAATAALFTDTFEDSSSRPLPKGWRSGSLDECVFFENSSRIPLSSAERSKRKGPFPYYGAAGPIDSVDDFLFDGEYVLVGEDGSVIDPEGKPVIQHVWGRFWVSNHAHVLKPKNGWSVGAILNLLGTVEIGQFVTGAVQPKLSMTNLKRVPVVIPTPEILESYARQTEIFLSRKRLNAEHIATLGMIRDTLLPRLISGKLRVPEAEKLVEAVL